MITLVTLLSLVAPADAGLAPKLAPLIKAHKGDVAIAVKHLGTGEAFYLNADDAMPTASLIKIAVLVELYLQADEGKVSVRDLVTLKSSDKVPGSGILTSHFSEGAALPLRDCARLMCVYSDNTATNLILDKVGIANVNKRMEAMGLKETKINAKVYRGSVTSVDKKRTAKYGLGSTTAREMVTLFEKLQSNDGFRPAIKLAMLEHLKKNEDTDKFGRLKLPGVVFAHKDGSVNAARTNAGIMYTRSGPIAICVLTASNKDQSWGKDNAGNKLCADVARAVHDYFHSPKKDTTP